MATLPELLRTQPPAPAETVAPPVPDPTPDPLRTARQFVGQPLARVDGRLKVTGQAHYAAEHPLAGLAHAVPVHSTIAKGNITALDTAAAEGVAGVLAVMTYRNAPPMHAPSAAMAVDKNNFLAAATTTLPLMPADIFWNGQIVALVVADTLEAATYAASLVGVRYAGQPAALALATERAAAFAPAHVVLAPTEIRIGDAAASLARAPVRTDTVYTTPAYRHNALEPHATIAAWPDEAHLTVYDSTQYVAGVREALAQIFDLPVAAVRVLTDFVGGAFGGKSMWAHVPLAAAAARLVRRPVKLNLPRASVNFTVGGRAQTEQRVALGATPDGQLTALVHTGLSTGTADVVAEPFSMAARHLYAVPHLHAAQQVVRLDQVQNTFMRAPGEAPGTFALESALDELAWALNLDPVALRLRNEPTHDPTTGLPFSSRRLPEAYALGAWEFGWNPARPAPGTTRQGAWLVGTGVATMYYPTQMLPVTVRTRLGADGTVTVATSSIEMGVGAATVQTQHIAERFGVPLPRARYVQGDSDLPVSRAIGGSAATASVGSAIWASAELLTDALLALAHCTPGSVLRHAARAEVALRAGGLYYKDQPGLGESFGTLLAAQDQEFIEVEANAGTLSPNYATASYGAVFCEVHVHADTREVRVQRLVAALDCGRIINPQTAASQIKGGLIMGLGMALLENALVDERTGRLLNPTLAEYHLPVQADVRTIAVHFLDVPDPFMPLGLKSVGEIGITGVAAAVANAVFQATGIRVRDLPITVDKLL